MSLSTSEKNHYGALVHGISSVHAYFLAATKEVQYWNFTEADQVF